MCTNTGEAKAGRGDVCGTLLVHFPTISSAYHPPAKSTFNILNYSPYLNRVTIPSTQLSSDRNHMREWARYKCSDACMLGVVCCIQQVTAYHLLLEVAYSHEQHKDT